MVDTLKLPRSVYHVWLKAFTWFAQYVWSCSFIKVHSRESQLKLIYWNRQATQIMSLDIDRCIHIICYALLLSLFSRRL